MFGLSFGFGEQQRDEILIALGRLRYRLRRFFCGAEKINTEILIEFASCRAFRILADFKPAVRPADTRTLTAFHSAFFKERTDSFLQRFL